MKQKKLSLANIQGKLSRADMKKIMAGSGMGCVTSSSWCDTTNNCTTSNAHFGICVLGWDKNCYCVE